jgi:mannosyltransferase OCH1-like enzyme
MNLDYIHQIWYQGEDKIPEKYKKYRKSIKDLHPNTTIITWDEKSITDLISTFYPDYYHWFNSLPLMIQKIDVAKCLILYIWGGVYVDMDIEAIKPLNELYEKDKIVVGEQGVNYIENLFLQLFLKLSRPLLNNGIIFSPPKHPFWEFYIPFLIDTINIKPYILEKMINELYVIVTSGPANLTAGITYYPNQEEIKIIEPKYLEPTLKSTNTDKFSDSYIIHHHTLTWCSSAFRYSLNNFTNSSLLAIILLILIVILLIVCIGYIFKRLITKSL